MENAKNIQDTTSQTITNTESCKHIWVYTPCNGILSHKYFSGLQSLRHKNRKECSCMHIDEALIRDLYLTSCRVSSD